jgi:hypothetical protein
MRKEQLASRQKHFSFVKLQQQELDRKRAILRQVSQFAQRTETLGLQKSAWTHYDVNIQAPMDFDAAREIIYQCSDSSNAYFWPISLEVKVPENKHPDGAPSRATAAVAADVQLSVKGQFVARR